MNLNDENLVCKRAFVEIKMKPAIEVELINGGLFTLYYLE